MCIATYTRVRLEIENRIDRKWKQEEETHKKSCGLSSYKYTERQKKLITSEWHSLKSTASNWLISLISTSKKTKVYFNPRGDKCNEIARGQVLKITEIACLSGWEFEADKSPYGGVYATRHWNWMNSYWMFWIDRLRGLRSELAQWAVSAIFEKWPFVI